jgi:hypothetical protein
MVEKQENDAEEEWEEEGVCGEMATSWVSAATVILRIDSYLRNICKDMADFTFLLLPSDPGFSLAVSLYM